MSIYLALILAFLGFSWKAEARLGDTKEQAIARYGEPENPSKHAGARKFHEEKGNRGPGWECMYCVDPDTYIKFMIVLFENKVEEIEIVRYKLSEEEIKEFLAKNAKGTGFVEKARLPQEGGLVGGESIVYYEKESGLRAVYTPMEDSLFIVSDFGYKYGFEERKKQEEEENEKKKKQEEEEKLKAQEAFKRY